MFHGLDRCQTMAGPKANARGKPVGFHLGILKDGNVFLLARWLHCVDEFQQVFVSTYFWVSPHVARLLCVTCSIWLRLVYVHSFCS